MVFAGGSRPPPTSVDDVRTGECQPFRLVGIMAVAYLYIAPELLTEIVTSLKVGDHPRAFYVDKFGLPADAECVGCDYDARNVRMHIKSEHVQDGETLESPQLRVDVDSWISVDDRLPESDGQVLFHAPSGDPDLPYINIAWYDPNRGWSLQPRHWLDAITHWQPCPEPPRSE